MQMIFQVSFIFLISFVGEILNRVIPLPIPGSVYGMIILFSLLLLGVIKLSWVEKASDFFVSILPFLCVPSAISVIDDIVLFKDSIWPIVIICIISTIIVMAVTGLISQKIRKAQGKICPEEASHDK